MRIPSLRCSKTSKQAPIFKATVPRLRHGPSRHACRPALARRQPVAIDRESVEASGRDGARALVAGTRTAPDARQHRRPKSRASCSYGSGTCGFSESAGLDDGHDLIHSRRQFLRCLKIELVSFSVLIRENLWRKNTTQTSLTASEGLFYRRTGGTTPVLSFQT